MQKRCLQVIASQVVCLGFRTQPQSGMRQVVPVMSESLYHFVSACLADMSSWMKDHHLQLNLAKTELLVVPSNPSFHHNFTFQLDSSTIAPSKTARNLGVVIDDKLNFTDHITKTARSCRFVLYNIKKIRPFLWEHATQLLQALVMSRLDYFNALLAGLPASSIKPLQLIQNAAERLIFNEPKRTHVTSLFINLHWLPIAAQCIKFKALMFAYRTTSGSAPLYLNSLLQTYMPSRSERRITVPSQRDTTSLSLTFTLTVPIWWPAQLNPSSWILTHLKKRLKTHLFIFIWPSNTSTLYSVSILSNLSFYYL